MSAGEGPLDELPTMPLVEHLRELRKRLIYSLLAVGIGVLISLAFSGRVLTGLLEMCTSCGEFQVLRPTEAFITYFRVALILGLTVAVPVMLYQIVAFVLPALHRHERRYLFLLLPGAGVMFALGLTFGYTVVLPRTIDFLATVPDVWFPTQGENVATNWSIAEYVAFVTNLLLIIGITFQTPIVVFLLSKVGILSPSTMARYRRHAIVVLAVMAAMLTPTPDPFTMMIVMLPMLLLYELGIILARVF